ncbi:MAG: gliding motility-associated C-terminal domain-containing protein [Saprospiraceae bacterium]
MTDTIQVSIEVSSADQICVELEPCMDEASTSYTTCSGVNAGITNYGEWVLNVNTGCINYASGTLAGDQVDTLCVIACDSLANVCDTTYIIVTITEELPCETTPDTVYVTMEVNASEVVCVELEECMDEASITYSTCAGVNFGVTPYGEWALNASNGCIGYNSGATPGDQVDTLCVIACDSSGVCDTTYMIITITEEVPCEAVNDTLYISVPVNGAAFACASLEACLDTAALSFTSCSGDIEGVTNYGSWILDVTTGCMTYTAGDQPGLFVDTLCIIACDSVQNVCDTTYLIITVTPDCPDIVLDEVVNLNIPDCDGQAEYCLDIPLNEIVNYTFSENGVPFNGIIGGCDNDSLFGYNYSLIPGQGSAGPYILDEWSINGVVFSGQFQDLKALVDSMNLWDPAGNWVIDNVILNIIGGDKVSDYGPLRMTQVNTFVKANIQLNDLFIPLGTLVAVDTGLHVIVITEISTGCTDTLTLNVNCFDCPEVYSGPVTLELADCNDLAEICLDINMMDLPDGYIITDNGDDYMGAIEPCDVDSFLSYNYFAVVNADPQGPYTVEFWIVNGQFYGGEVQDIQALVDSMNVWDPTGNWQLDETTQMITGGDPQKDYGILRVLKGGSELAVLQPNSLIVPNGAQIQLAAGSHELVITSTETGCVNTYSIEVECTIAPPEYDIIDTVVVLGDTDTLCLDIDDVGTIISFSNLCPDLSDGNVSIQWFTGTSCFAYTGLNIGVDTFCIEICGDLGCDSTMVIIHVIPPTMSTDTIETTVLIGFTDTLCLSPQITGQIDTVFNICPDASGMFADIVSIDGTPCLEITGEAIGTDTACIVICDDLGTCDTTIVVVHVVPPTPETVVYTIDVGQDSIHCLDLNELSGTVLTVTDICADQEIAVDWTINDTTLCIEFTGLAEGADTACIVFCDAVACDTVYIVVNVIPGGGPTDQPPVAVNDSSTVKENRMVIINVMANDTLNGPFTGGGIITGPTRGTVTGTLPGNFTYKPQNGFCGGVDSFTYYIANAVGMDTATVYVTVVCRTLVIYSGFSPNGDDINDTFMIDGIDDYPNNELTVFNRWGNQVFYRRGYTTDGGWDGRWEGNDLPDGTYFYILRDGEGETYSGYVQIHR